MRRYYTLSRIGVNRDKNLHSYWQHDHASLYNAAEQRKGAHCGGDFGSEATATAELYDPATGIFTATGSMTISRHVPTAPRLSDGKVLIAGGWTLDSSSPPYGADTADLCDPATGHSLPLAA